MSRSTLVEVELMARWLRANITGCLFAARFAHGLHPFVLNGRDVDAGIGDDFDPYISNAIQENGVAMFIFPKMRTPREVARLLACLDQHRDWSLSVPAWKRFPRPEDILLRLDFHTPQQKLSTPVGFAPFGSMPVLRRAPYVSLALWPGDSGNPHKPAKGRRVSLADMSFRPDDISKNSYDMMFEASSRNKEQFLDGQDEDAASHNVTFCLPTDPAVMAALPPELLSA